MNIRIPELNEYIPIENIGIIKDGAKILQAKKRKNGLDPLKIIH